MSDSVLVTFLDFAGLRVALVACPPVVLAGGRATRATPCVQSSNRWSELLSGPPHAFHDSLHFHDSRAFDEHRIARRDDLFQ